MVSRRWRARQEVVATHFFSADLPEGVMTFGAISTEEEAVAITSGVASYTDGVSTVYASDGTSLYRLEPDTLTLTHLSEFEDASGPVDGITSMHRVQIDGEEILFVRTTDTIRLLDVSALVLSSPLALLDVHPTSGAVDRLFAQIPDGRALLSSSLRVPMWPWVTMVCCVWVAKWCFKIKLLSRFNSSLRESRCVLPMRTLRSSTSWHPPSLRSLYTC